MHKKSLLLLPFLVLSWFLPITHHVWEYIDNNTYLWLNSLLVNRPFLQNATAWINSRYGDWFYEAIMLGTYLAYIAFPGDKSRRRRILNMVCVLTCIALTQFLINKMVFCKLLSVTRQSPSMILGGQVDLSVFDYPNNKVISYNSFPADHATTLFLCSFFSWRHFHKPVAAGITIFSILLVVPRLASGAHWLSDVILGAGIIATAAYCLYDFLSRRTTFSI